MLSILIFTFVIREDTIIYSVNTDNSKDALTMIKKIYREDNPEDILLKFKANVQKNAS